MYRKLFFVLTLLATLSATAQEVSYGITAFGGASTLKIDPDVTRRVNSDTELRPSFGGELMLNLVLGEHFELETKAGFMVANTYNEYGSQYIENSFKSVIIKPVNLKMHIGYPNKVGFVVGPHLGMNLFGETTYNFTEIDPTTLEETEEEFSGDMRIGETRNDDYKQMNLGVRFGPFVQFENGLYASLDYTYGISDLTPEKTGAFTTRLNSFTFHIGYLISNLIPEKE